MNSTPIVLSLGEVLEIHRDQIEQYGGDVGIRDLGLLRRITPLSMVINGLGQWRLWCFYPLHNIIFFSTYTPVVDPAVRSAMPAGGACFRWMVPPARCARVFPPMIDWLSLRMLVVFSIQE